MAEKRQEMRRLLAALRVHPRLHLLELPLPDEVTEERLEVRPVGLSEEVGELRPCHLPRRKAQDPLSSAVPGHHCPSRIQRDNQVIGALHHAGQMALHLSDPLAQALLLGHVVHEEHDAFYPSRLVLQGCQAIKVDAGGQSRRSILHLASLKRPRGQADCPGPSLKVGVVEDRRRENLVEPLPQHLPFFFPHFGKKVLVGKDHPETRVHDQDGGGNVSNNLLFEIRCGSLRGGHFTKGRVPQFHSELLFSEQKPWPYHCVHYQQASCQT